MNKTQKNNRGFSLIEVLIALLLISVGVLGMVAMQGKAITYTQDSVQRNAAAALANDLLELMRAQPAGLPAASDFYKAAGTGFASVSSADCVATPTSASAQLACWADKVNKQLPVSESLLTNDFYICRTTVPGTCTTAGSAVEIQLAWQVRAGACMDSGDDENTSTICYYRLRSEL
ncbi:MAG: type IV pilus modification protein PilV [Sulfuriferula multivorans]|uniref:Type IV pilus modification protein PilV n=1 Tax=Sulfuriferula multivorans TaxID=1559896 RepID=A0A7C9TD83_9PROT|nr:type IV pilus modification protein PilV [Sulfuriferula multivorans]